MKNKASLGKRKLLTVIVIMLLSMITGYLPSSHTEGEGIKTFGINHDGFLEMNDEVLYMLVDGERVKATLNGLIEKGDTNQELLMESDLDHKQGVIASIFSFLKPVKAKAAAPKIEYKGAISYRGSIVGDFRVDGKQAYCFQHSKASPPTGSKYKEPTPYDDERVQRALYYGWGGDENIFKDKKEGVVTTSLILDRLYSGGSSGKSLPNYDKLWDLVVNGESLDRSIKFSDRDLNVSVKGNKQVSQTTTFKTSEKNHTLIKVPSGITIVNESTGKKITGGPMKVHGGQKIHLEAPLDKALNYNTGDLKSGLKIFRPLIAIPNGGNYQVLGFGELFTDPNNTTSFKAKFEVRQKKITVQHIDKHNNNLLKEEKYTRNIGTEYSFDPKSSITDNGDKYIPVDKKTKKGVLGNKDVTVKFYYNLQRKVTVKHVDARDDRVIKTESDLYVRGSKYSYKPKKDLKKGDYTYRPVSTTVQKGEIGSKDIVITFYYDVPLIKASMKKIQIYTELASKGLPVKINLDRVNVYPDSVNDMSKEKIKLSIYQGKKVVATKEYTAKSLPTKTEMKIPATDLVVNKKKAYTVKLEGFNKNAFDIATKTAALTTDGYAASQKKVTVNAANATSLEYKGVVMTEREINKDMKLYYETLSIPLKPLSKMRTGYGFEMPVNINYKNEISTWSDDVELLMKTPTSIVDKSYIDYPVKNKIASVPLEKTKGAATKSGNSTTISNTYELQHVNVEKQTGSLFTDEQVRKKDKRIKHELINGERKFYLPIWGDIGDYKFTFESTKAIGVNQVSFVVNHNLNVYAHMIAHMDSKSIKEDAVLMKPISLDNPFPEGLPKGWTSKDEQWIKK
ncbi:thioester domain-containing protein [Bacillus stratosphericus]|uniref:thioester domain-containing protein n=1 Tax=Bacillus stratosphericus TaxID=293386 RepID=UPI001CFB8F8F|nr:thioester domain-containing protein [Bacillus stratosphericus]